MRASIRLYLHSASGSYHPIAWFKSHQENWLLWSPYGLDARQATLRGEWPDEYVALDDESERRYAATGFALRSEKVDHFGWHPDGIVLRKSADKQPIYSQKMQLLKPLGVDSPLFLELHIQTEAAAAYRAENVVGHDAVTVATELGSGIKAYVVFAGRNYPLANYINESCRPGWQRGPIFELGNFRGAIMFETWRPDRVMVEERMRGTLIGLRFRLQSEVFVHRTFLFV